jgi:DNA-binding XRE family transcriptional regulator
MNTLKKARLQNYGWAVADTAEFLNLNSQEAPFVDLKLTLAAAVRELREKSGMTQAALAEQLGSSQSRVAKMETADRSVTVDLMMRSLMAIGALPSTSRSSSNERRRIALRRSRLGLGVPRFQGNSSRPAAFPTHVKCSLKAGAAI